MPIFAISDLHLCDRGPRDNFAFNGREERLGAFLDMVDREQGRLLILGDLFDFWQVNLGTAVVAYLPLLDRLAGMGATWIVGNHDNALAPLIGSNLMLDHPLFRDRAIRLKKKSPVGGLPSFTATSPIPIAAI